MSDKNIDKITKYLAILGSGAAVFYILGFIVIKTFTNEIKLEGISLLTDDLYRDSGASFILDMVRVPLFTPHLFFPWLTLLYFLALPREKELLSLKKYLSSEERGKMPAVWRKVFLLIFLLAATFFLAVDYGRLLPDYSFQLVISALTFYLKDALDPAQKGSLIFFSFITPMILVFGIFIYRFGATLKNGAAGYRIYRRFYQISCFLYAAFLLTVPISYGINIYDWNLARVKNPGAIKYILSEETGKGFEESAPSSSNVWFIGDFGGKYLFLAKKDPTAHGVIALIDQEKLKHLDFFTKMTGSLRQQMIDRSVSADDEAGLPLEAKDVDQFLGVGEE